MSNPWDRPPIPTTGDAFQDTTYAAVGRVLSRWEEVEVSLGHLYASFTGRGKAVEVLREYGSGRIFLDRIRILETAAATYFRANPCQRCEGGFDRIVERCLGWSGRRNDIAHGIVQPMRFRFVPSQKRPGFIDCLGYEFCVFPPYYDPRRHTQSDPDDPDYGFTSIEMKALCAALATLSYDTDDYRAALFPSPLAQP